MTHPIPFARMNGLGNEILVADLRGTSARIAPQAARALAAMPETHFDQIMAIHDPVTPAPSPMCASSIRTARKPEPAATACAAWCRR